MPRTPLRAIELGDLVVFCGETYRVLAYGRKSNGRVELTLQYPNGEGAPFKAFASTCVLVPSPADSEH